METIVIILLIGIGLVISSDTTTYSETTEEAQQSESVEAIQNDKIMLLDSYPVLTIDAEDWLCKYADNALDADKQLKMRNDWKHQYIKLTGRIYRVNNDYIDGCRITIRQQRSDSLVDGWCIICCYIYDDTEIEKALKMKKGDDVTLIGFSRWDNGPVLINSYIR